MSVNIDYAVREMLRLGREGVDLGGEYWDSIIELLKKASIIDIRLESTSKDNEILRAKLDKLDPNWDDDE